MLDDIKDRITKKLAKLSEMNKDSVIITNQSLTFGVLEDGNPVDYTNLTISEDISEIELKMESVAQFPMELYDGVSPHEIQETRNAMKRKAKELGCDTKETSSRFDISCSRQVKLPKDNLTEIDDTLNRMHKELQKKLEQI